MHWTVGHIEHGPLTIMASATIGIAILGLLLFCSDSVTQAQAIRSCVRDARTALDAEWHGAFGPDAIVEGPKTVPEIERESLTRVAKCTHCPQKPFGYQYTEWEQFKRLVRPRDCVVFFRSNPASWEALYGTEGYALVRNGRILRSILTSLS